MREEGSSCVTGLSACVCCVLSRWRCRCERNVRLRCAGGGGVKLWAVSCVVVRCILLLCDQIERELGTEIEAIPPEINPEVYN